MKRLNFVRRLLGIAIMTSASVSLSHAAPALREVPLKSVSIDDPFWSPKLDVWRSVTIKDCLDKFERDGVLKNFDYVANGEKSRKFGGNVEHHGAPWFDGLTYEMIRGCADFMVQKPDPALKARLDQWIDHIAAAGAVDPDGYLNTYTTLEEPTHRWGQNGGNERFQHDIYNLSCLVEAGVHYYRATGETKLLATAVRAANYMSRVMGPSPKQNIVPGHAIGEETLVRLYDLFKEQPDLKVKLGVPVNENDYLALAKFWLDARGHHEGRESFGAYNQDGAPVLDVNTIEGHAVRAALMGDGLIAVGRATGQQKYIEAAQRWWQNMVGRRMYLTGGIGSYADDEKFGPDFYLPNDAYAETCAAVANGFFSHKHNLAHADAAGADEVERTLYNNVLSGVSLVGNSYFYMNPLQAGRNHARWDWHGCPCCPPMFLKLMGALPGYIYAQDDANGVYVNLFMGSTAKLNVGGKAITLKQTTKYPWEGDVSIALSTPEPTPLDLYVRIPGWTGASSRDALYTYSDGAIKPVNFLVNGQPIEPASIERGYAKISRVWKEGDTVSVRLRMSVRRVTADERVEANRGRVAFMRGPIVYCVESLVEGKSLRDVVVTADMPITAQRQDDLGGVIGLSIPAKRLQYEGEPTTETLTAIPFYANTNRGPAEMGVWLPANESAAVRPTLASVAKASASHCFERDTVTALNYGGMPTSSVDNSRPRFTWWDHRGTKEWVQYDFDKPRKIDGAEVYWWDDAKANGQCRVPQSWSLRYKAADGSWKPLPGNPTFDTSLDTFNKVSFEPVETTALRIEAQLQPEFSAGILLWKVHEAGKVP
jgi:DUF1680 family protein